MDHLVAVAVWDLLSFPLLCSLSKLAWAEQQPHISTLLLPPVEAETLGVRWMQLWGCVEGKTSLCTRARDSYGEGKEVEGGF